MGQILAIFYQNFAYQDLVVEIFRRFQAIELLFQSNLHHPILFETFKHAHTRKVRWAFGSFTVRMIHFAIYWILFDKTKSYDVMLHVMKFIAINVYMNVLFFIELVVFYLEHLNAIIANENNECGAADGNVCVVKKVRTAELVCEQLSKYKTIHFSLWKITEQLNRYFGWTMLAITLQAFVELVIVTLWTLKVLSEYGNSWTLTRKTS